MTTREATAEGGRPLIGRGYQLLADDGSVVAREALRPTAGEPGEAGDRGAAGAGERGAAADLLVARVEPGSVEQRQALAFPNFGVDRPVTLRPGEDGVAVLDSGGRRQAGWIAADDAPAVADRLARDQDVATWVCWEWLAEPGRTGIEVALSRPGLAPRPLGPPPAGAAASARATADRRVWLAAAAVLVLIAVGLATCG